MTTYPPYTRVVTQALMGADRPLTVAEVLSRVEMVRPVDSRDPKATIRGAIGHVRRIVTLGGQPTTPGGPATWPKAPFASRWPPRIWRPARWR